MIKIDIDTRCWQIPKEEAFLGVESDDKVKILQFELSKNEFLDGLNFTDCNCFINYKNNGNDTISYGITDMAVQEDGTVTFTWEVSRGATIFKGNTFAILCAKKVHDDGTIMNEWNSRIGTFTVAKGLEPLSSITEVPEIDIISQLLLVAKQTNANAQNNIEQSNSLLEKAEGLGYLKEEYDVLEARMNQFTSLQEGSTTGDAELQDIRVGTDGKTYDNAGDAVRGQVSELKGDLGNLLYFPKEYWTMGSITVPIAGAWSHKIVLCEVDLSEMSGDFLKVSVGNISDEIDTHYCYINLLDENENNISEGHVQENTFANGIITSEGGHTIFNLSEIKNSVKYIKIQAQAYRSTAPTISGNVIYSNISAKDVSEENDFIAEVKESNLSDNLKDKLHISDNKGFVINNIGAMNSNNIVAIASNHIKKNKTLIVSAKVDSFTDKITIGHGIDVYGGAFLEITPTTLNVYKYDTQSNLVKTVSHGLTIANDIFVEITNFVSKYGFHATIKIVSQGQIFTQSSKYDFPWIGGNGNVFIKTGTDTVLSDCKVCWSCSDLSADIHAFGDSYFDYWNPKIADLGHSDKFLFDGFGGRNSTQATTSLNFCLEHGTPKYVLWCLGMNDPDDGAINSNWKNGFDSVISACKEKGITPIFSTIPNTPRNDNSYKNAYIKASGYRYVDIAHYVGADESGSGWYGGLLSSDNIHPTDKGAYIIAQNIITDLADIIFAN